jgi:hypothetical protein
MRTVVGIATLALATTMFATPAFADDAPAGGAAAAASTAAPAAPAASADDDGKKIGLGGDLVFTLPLGDYADASGPGIGLTVRAGYYVMPQFEAYVRAGYELGLKKEIAPGVKTGLNNIPIYVGGRYFFMQPYAGLYGSVELGANLFSFSIDPDVSGPAGDALKETRTRFGATVGAGYVISKDLPINIGAQFALLNLIGKENGEKDIMGINILAGYQARF